MSESNIEYSKDGIKFPYRRYLSDSTPGFILILSLIISYYNNYQFLGLSPQHLIPVTALSEAKIFALLLLFLLATPIGVIINVIGWVALEAPQKGLEKIIYKTRILKKFEEEHDLEKCRTEFKITKKNWFRKVRTLEIALISDFPEKSERIEALRGIAILLRNLALMSVFAALCGYISSKSPQWIFLGLGISHFPAIVTLCLLGAVLFSLSAFISFYFHVQIVHSAYILSKATDAKDAKYLRIILPELKHSE